MLFIVLVLLAVASAAPVEQDKVAALANPIDVEVGVDGVQTVISLGTPGQDFNVILDTNVAGLWIPGVNCNEDLDGASCDNKNVFDPKESFTFTETKKNVKIPFLGKKIDSNVAFDRFRFGPHYESAFTENNIKFGIVKSLPEEYEDIQADGVLGLGLISDNNLDSPFVQLMKRGNFPNPVLSVYIPRYLTPASSAYVSLGSEDLENCQKSSDSVALVPGRNWA